MNKFSEYMKHITESKTAMAAPEKPDMTREMIKQIANIILKEVDGAQPEYATKAAEKIVSRFIHYRN